jgi:hypothetical protein
MRIRKIIATKRILLLVPIAAICVILARAAAPATQPSPIQYRRILRTNPPLQLHVVTVDLTDPRVALRVARGADDPDGDGPWQTRLDTVRNIATRQKLAVAVNGNFFFGKEGINLLGKQVPYFAGNWASVNGYAMSDGVLWSKDKFGASLVVDAKGGVSIGRFGSIPNEARQVVSGSDMLLIHGRNVAVAKDLAPRTAIGIDKAGKQLTLIVVDGRREDVSVGMTAAQVGEELVRLGCWDALMLDGGGSSTLVMRDPADQTVRLMNHPSDGHDLPMDLSIERPVADAFGVMLRDGPTTRP